VLLSDTVTVENEEIGLSIQLYVSELEWDAIREKITALKLVNTNKYSKGTVTGYNVQAKSIGSDKLADDVTDAIMAQVSDIMPEYADPQASRPATVSVTDGDPTLSWGSRSKVGTVQGTDLHVTMPANPDTWRPVQDNLNSTSTTDSLSAKQGKVLNEKIGGLVTTQDATISFSGGVGAVAARSGYQLMNVIARNRSDASYSPIGMTMQTDGSYKINAIQSFTANLQCRLFWLKV
jgi:hypothetical protein